MSVKREVYHSFSDSLLKTSKFFAKLSFNIELEYKNKKVPEEIKENNKSYVTGSIFSSVAFLESIINELFWSALKAPTGFARALNENLKNKMAKFLANFENRYNYMSTLEKYQFTLFLNGQDLFEKGKNPFQDVKLVIELRNELIHFEPEMIDAEKNKQTWEDQLRGEFNQCPFYKETFLFLPHRCLSYGCARWAVISCIKFVNDFYKKIGVNKIYDEDNINS